MPDQLPLPLPKTIRINGDQFFDLAEKFRESASYQLREAAIFEQMAIEAWAKAERERSITAVDPYLQTR